MIAQQFDILDIAALASMRGFEDEGAALEIAAEFGTTAETGERLADCLECLCGSDKAGALEAASLRKFYPVAAAARS